MSKNKKTILKLIEAVSNEDYHVAQAHVKSIVEDKLQQRISKTYQNFIATHEKRK